MATGLYTVTLILILKEATKSHKNNASFGKLLKLIGQSLL
jgi:hypothetical protein